MTLEVMVTPMSNLQSPPPIPKPASSPRRLPLIAKLGISLSAVVLVVYIGGVFTIYRWSASAASKLEQKRAALRAEGIPITLEELDAWYPYVSEEKNAAPIYAEATASLESIDPDARGAQLSEAANEYDHISDFPPDLIASSKTYFSDIAHPLSLLRSASHRSATRFPIDFTKGSGLNLDLSHLSKLRGVARLLCLASEIELIEGNIPMAVEYHTGAVSAGCSLTAEPVLISQLSRIATIGIALEGLERLINHAQMDEPYLRSLDMAYSLGTRPDSFRRAVLSEQCMILETMRQLFDGSLSVDDEELDTQISELKKVPPYVRNHFLLYEHTKILEVFEPWIPPAAPNWPDIVASKADWEYPSGPLFSAPFIPDIQHAGRAFVRDVAVIRIARTALAIERYRLANGELPESLGDCVPQFLESLPEDPFDGAPLRYRREHVGYTIYSVYDDLVDDDGTHYIRSEGDTRDGDFVFFVAR